MYTCMHTYLNQTTLDMQEVHVHMHVHVLESNNTQYAGERKLLVALLAYVETGTNSRLFYLKYIPKVLQGPLKGKESR